MSAFEVSSVEANRWWQQNTLAGVLLNRLMLVFIFAPIVLVFRESYRLSFVVFALMVPYGLLVRQLAVRAVRNHLALHPGELAEFSAKGIISN